MLDLFVHQDARQDLDKLWESDEDAAAIIEATLDEVRGSEQLLDTLTAHNFGQYPNEGVLYSISKWLYFWRQGKDLWRLKVWELEEGDDRWRVIYAYIPQESKYYVLGIAPREFDYEPDHPITQRILAAYEDLR